MEWSHSNSFLSGPVLERQTALLPHGAIDASNVALCTTRLLHALKVRVDHLERP